MYRYYEDDSPESVLRAVNSGLGILKTGKAIGDEIEVENSQNRLMQLAHERGDDVGALSFADINNVHDMKAMGLLQKANMENEGYRTKGMQARAQADTEFYNQTIYPTMSLAQQAYDKGDYDQFAYHSEQLSNSLGTPYRIKRTPEGDGFSVFFRKDGQGFVDTGRKISNQEAYNMTKQLADGTMFYTTGLNGERVAVNPHYNMWAEAQRINTTRGNILSSMSPTLMYDAQGKPYRAAFQNKWADYNADSDVVLFDAQTGQKIGVFGASQLSRQGFWVPGGNGGMKGTGAGMLGADTGGRRKRGEGSVLGGRQMAQMMGGHPLQVSSGRRGRGGGGGTGEPAAAPGKPQQLKSHEISFLKQQAKVSYEDVNGNVKEKVDNDTFKALFRLASRFGLDEAINRYDQVYDEALSHAGGDENKARKMTNAWVRKNIGGNGPSANGQASQNQSGEDDTSIEMTEPGFVPQAQEVPQAQPIINQTWGPNQSWGNMANRQPMPSPFGTRGQPQPQAQAPVQNQGPVDDEQIERNIRRSPMGYTMMRGKDGWVNLDQQLAQTLGTSIDNLGQYLSDPRNGEMVRRAVMNYPELQWRADQVVQEYQDAVARQQARAAEEEQVRKAQQDMPGAVYGIFGHRGNLMQGTPQAYEYWRRNPQNSAD